MGICVACRSDQRIVVRISSQGVPHGTAGHQIGYRWTDLTACPECGAGLLVRFDHDCFPPPGEEPWDMDWSWPVDAGGVRRLISALARCPDPLLASCECPGHRALRDSTERAFPRAEAVTIVLTGDGLPQVRSLGGPTRACRRFRTRRSR